LLQREYNEGPCKKVRTTACGLHYAIAGDVCSDSDERTLGACGQARHFGDFSVDYKALHLNDTITIQVAVQTTAAQSGTVDSERSFTSSSAITASWEELPRQPTLFCRGVRLRAEGQGSTASNTLFQTNLTGQVIAVLPNGNLVLRLSARFI